MVDDQRQGVFRALSDPTRRSILDLLRSGPMTTGDLAARFDMSRYGVMKHLGVLHHAGLVLVRRDGRQRFNHLNAVPLREIVERWVSQYAAPVADSLPNLERCERGSQAWEATESQD